MNNDNEDIIEDVIKSLMFQKNITINDLDDIVQLLNNLNFDIVNAAIELLGSMGDAAVPYLEDIVKKLKSENSYFHDSALKAIGNIGSAAKIHIPLIINKLGMEGMYRIFSMDEGLNYDDPAIFALSHMGASIRPYLPNIAKLLNHDNYRKREAAMIVLSLYGNDTVEYLPRIGSYINSDDNFLRTTSYYAIINYGSLADNYISKIADRLDKYPCRDADSIIYALSKSNAYLEKYFKKIIFHLPHLGIDSWGQDYFTCNSIGNPVLYVLSKKYNKVSDEEIKYLINLLESKKSAYRALSISALDKIETTNTEIIWKIKEQLGYYNYEEELFDHSELVRSNAVCFLGKKGAQSSDFILEIMSLLNDHSESVRKNALKALEYISKAELDQILYLLNCIYSSEIEASEIRFVAHLVGAGRKDIEYLLKWVGTPPLNQSNQIEYSKGVELLKFYNTIWPHCYNYKYLREEIALKLAYIITQSGIIWRKSDLELLNATRSNLKGYVYYGSVENIISNFERNNNWYYYVPTFLIGHFCFWILLIFLYSYSPLVQSLFFWNPYVRKIGGLGYVNLLIIFIPFLRRKILSPFKEPLISDANLNIFKETEYYKDTNVRESHTKKLRPLLNTIKRIQGQIIIVGESGLGKSMFLKYLVLNSNKPLVFLHADKCIYGVVAAIEKKLHGIAKDRIFLKSLIYSGAVDICIDGINEVSSEVRAKITEFMERNPKGNIIVCTQPFPWPPPSTAKVWLIEPLSCNQIKEFLTSQVKFLLQETEQNDDVYLDCANRFLLEALTDEKDEDIKSYNYRVLSNPMDLTVVAKLIIENEKPNLFNLHEQHFNIMNKCYRSVYFNRSFPINKFSKMVYEERLKESQSIPTDLFLDELIILEKYKLVTVKKNIDQNGKESSQWFFRHERFSDYFISKYFMYNTELLETNIDDSRFRSVYLLLATILPNYLANKLRERFIIHAAITKNHTISDEFIKILINRKKEGRSESAD